MNPPGLEEELERYKLSVFTWQKLVESMRNKKIDNRKQLITLATSTLDNWMVKVAKISRSDVKQKEKKP